MKKAIATGIAATLMATSCAVDIVTEWPETNACMKPGSRWWWMGSAVDSANISELMKEYAESGLGSMEITPIYGVKGNDKNEIEFLSKKWTDMLAYSKEQAKLNNMNLAMNTGTGWPFGGKKVQVEDAAHKMYYDVYKVSGGKRLQKSVICRTEKQYAAELLRVIAYSDKGDCIDITANVDKHRNLSWTPGKGEWTVYAVFCGNTFQKVKRAAPGGEGLVIDHFSAKAVKKYLDEFTKALGKNPKLVPDEFFNDSYEVYKADITPEIFEEFKKRRGYRLEEHFRLLVSDEKSDKAARVKSDYCETLGELLLENFTAQWTKWAHDMGAKTRNQAHGSPANLIDIYAAVDVPEAEGFGLTDFKIEGLREDTMTRDNDADISMLKYASSAAHISGRHVVSAEALTWLTEHFRTSLSQCKPDIDQLFLAGINRINMHGTAYSPKGAEWPGWKFYASVDMSPTNPQWEDAREMFKYIERVQSFMQLGEPDNDFLIYLPIYDMWHEQSEMLQLFSIHNMAKRAPEFIKTITSLYEMGYSVDYTSDKYLLSAYVDREGMIHTDNGARYKAVIIPNVKRMPIETLRRIVEMTENGATVLFHGQYPEHVPGMRNYEAREQTLKNIVSLLPNDRFLQTNMTEVGRGRVVTGNDYKKMFNICNLESEQATDRYGLKCIRRKNEYGYHYFFVNLTPKEVDETVTLSVPAMSAILFDPMTGRKGRVDTHKSVNGNVRVRLQLTSGESVIVRTIDEMNIGMENWMYRPETAGEIDIDKGWRLSFVKSEPEVKDTFEIGKPYAWTSIDRDDLKCNMGTALYETDVDMEDTDRHRWTLDLGDVRESARVSVNGSYVTTLWALPYRCDVTDYIKEGTNHIAIEVTGLPANRIAQMDREGKVWRIFEQQMMDINYKASDYSGWATMPCGLNSKVTLKYN